MAAAWATATTKHRSNNNSSGVDTRWCSSGRRARIGTYQGRVMVCSVTRLTLGQAGIQLIEVVQKPHLPAAVRFVDEGPQGRTGLQVFGDVTDDRDGHPVVDELLDELPRQIRCSA